MKIVIFGIGERGKRIYSRLHKEEVVAFIDNNSSKVGMEYDGKKVISLKEYQERYLEYFILISVIYPEQIKRQLQENGITRYFCLIDCPTELQMPGDWRFFDKYLTKRLAKERIYGIYGTSFYSIYLYSRLSESGYKNIYIIPEPETNEKTIKEWKDCFEVKIYKENSVKIECILFSLNKVNIFRELKRTPLLMKDDVEVIDLFDNIRNIPEYRNENLTKFHNKHIGEKCFIVATGPSLQMDDLEMIRKSGIRSISMNRIYLAFEKTKWRPDYYLCGDEHAIRESAEIITKMPVKYKFIGDSYPQFWNGAKEKNIFKLHFHWAETLDGDTRFSEDISYGVYCSETVTYACIQTAVYLGFREIYLLGVDFNFSSNYSDPANHFIENYYKPNEKTNTFRQKDSYMAYRTAKKFAEPRGIKIYNATRGGKLDVFERVEFDSIF